MGFTEWCILLGLLGCLTNASHSVLTNNVNEISKEVKGFLPATMADMVLPHGYPLEEHEVVTDDGYILTVYRIPYGKDMAPGPRPPLLLQHGILCSSACWVLCIPEKGLGFVLADAGYDVWMGNSRGSTYSLKHKYLDPKKDKEKYWDFSFHEMGYYDLPATIDYMLKKTNQSKVHYVAHSQGTSMFYAMASTRPEYNQRVHVMASLAPIAFLDGTRGAVHILSKFSSILAWVARHLGLYNVLSDNVLLRFLDRTICRKTAITRPMCDNLLFLIAGYDSQQLNVSLVPIIAEHCPAGSSIKQLTHFAQLANNGRRFQQYDYGHSENLIKYGTKTPPDYDLSKITTPIILHFADNDWLAGVQDVDYLFEKLSNSKGKMKIEVPFPYFNHLDFMWAIDVNPLLYDKVIEILHKFPN